MDSKEKKELLERITTLIEDKDFEGILCWVQNKGKCSIICRGLRSLELSYGAMQLSTSVQRRLFSDMTEQAQEI